LSFGRKDYPAPIDDPDLGRLTYGSFGWRSRQSDGALRVDMVAGREGPDAALRRAAGTAIGEKLALESRARGFLERSAEWDDSRSLTLAGMQVRRSTEVWIEQVVAPTRPAIAIKLRSGAPVVVLQFVIVGDANVLDVLFIDGEPFQADYH
jgi:hypothetical protein